MFHGLTHEIIYSAAKTRAVFVDEYGKEKIVSGTAFSLMIGDKHALVTNRHITDLDFDRTDSKYISFRLDRLLCETRGRDKENGSPGEVKRFIIPLSHNEVLYDEDILNDVAVIYDVQSGNLDGSEDRLWDYCFKYEDLATEDEIYSELHPFDTLAFPGYPDGFDRQELRAIIRKGTAACDPRFQYSYDDQPRGEILLYEGFSYGGSSGSPMIATPKVPPLNLDPNPANQFRRMLVVGVNAGHLNGLTDQHPGLSYFVRSSVIRRIIDKNLHQIESSLATNSLQDG